MLDSKEPEDTALLRGDGASGLPRLDDFLSAASRARFDEVRAGLQRAGVAFVVDPLLVRGLDYYCHTAFEFVGKAGLTVLAGGRYDGLVAGSGGPEVPGIG